MAQATAAPQYQLPSAAIANLAPAGGKYSLKDILANNEWDKIVLSKDGNLDDNGELYQQFYDLSFGLNRDLPQEWITKGSDRGGPIRVKNSAYTPEAAAAAKEARALTALGYQNNVFTQHKSTGLMGFADKVALPLAIAALTLGTGGLASTGISGSGGVGMGAGGGAGTAVGGGAVAAPSVASYGIPGFDAAAGDISLLGAETPLGTAYTPGFDSVAGAISDTAGEGMMLGGVGSAGGVSGAEAGIVPGIGGDVGFIPEGVPNLATTLAQMGTGSGPLPMSAMITNPGQFIGSLGASDWLSIGGGLYGLYQAEEQRKLAKKAAEMQDPFGPQRAQYAEQLKKLNADPSSVTKLPGYQFGMDQGTKALTRQMAATGYTGSGNEAIALQDFGQKYAGEWYNAERDRLASLAGAQFGPSGGNTLLAGNVNANDILARSLASIGYGLAGRRRLF